MTLPTFFLIGAGRSGTTSLYHYLGQHPDVYMSPVKEPNFFALEGTKLDFRGPGDREWIRQSATTIEEYEALFEVVNGEKAVGEASPGYLCVPGTAERIRRRVPEAKLIAVLRNPIDRAYASCAHKARLGQEPLSFSDALEAEEHRMRDNWSVRWAYKRMGFYHAHLSRYYELFDPAQIQVHLHEDLHEDPVGMIQYIFRFIGVDDAFVPNTSLRHNTSGVAKSRALVRLVEKPNPLKSALKPLLTEGLRKRIRVYLHERNLKELPPLTPEVRRALISAYRADILALQGLIGRDLSGWLAH